MGLKTLKDLEIHLSPYVKNLVTGEETYAEKSVKIEELRQEAIKWVKRMHENGNFISVNPFMDFFNLTEEDLEDDTH